MIDVEIKCKSFLRGFIYFNKGATSVEYAILASAIAAVIAAIVFAMGLSVLAIFEGFNNLYSQYFPG